MSTSDRVKPTRLREDLVTQACLEAYAAVRHEGRLADRALDVTLRNKRHLYSTERRAVAERVYALLRRQRTVDHLLERSGAQFERLGATEKDLVRLALARVLSGEAPTAVAESDAWLRAFRKTFEKVPAELKLIAALPPVERLGILGSVPEFLARRLFAEWKDDSFALLEAMNERGPLTARVNTLKNTREEAAQALVAEGVACSPTPYSPLGLTLNTRTNAYALEAFRSGRIEIQDEGSQLLGMLVSAPPKKVVDACAGAGGKTLQLAAEMKNRGELFALDVDERRMEDLRKRARRAGVHNVRTQVIPPGPEALDALGKLLGEADRVLVDAPCSGTGTFRRKPDARYRLAETDVAMFASRQLELLRRFARLVRPGGRLVYGTCSVLAEENERVAEAFLGLEAEFALVDAATILGAELGPKVVDRGYLRLLPHTHGTDGFFGAVFRRSPS